ncbi:aminotransferase class I/II-fold pyridoxal phosphate-dependent enzyme [Actinotalea sp. Marseille-Q4924]|uniref:aminotransferase class I/II-fold pyridoxal phosphate-dependent enzyme n=1 Tax=Actinotalea sp. Marseille-Q4924 TaxID=2866571 RepID=UPI001CE40251|nr:aminotransferase class I/II-fold pyridoxal phosphate-dependent enzyme [Actinotalea sp. Marseille-Q4924]
MSPAPEDLSTDDAAVRPSPLPPEGAELVRGLRHGGSLKWTGVDAEIAAWVAESDLGTAPAVRDAAARAVTAGLTGYLPPRLRRELGEATADWYDRRYGWRPRPERVHPVADVLEALRVTVDHLTRAGSPVVVPTPAYMPFLTAPRQWGREVLEVPMATDTARGHVLDLHAVAAAFRAGGQLLVLTNPHNPTGRVHTTAELEALTAVVEHHGGRVFSDEIHAPLVHEGHTHVPYASTSAAAAAHTVTATSASKAWNVPGLKCAQVLLTADHDVAAWRRVDHLATHGASTVGVVANVAAYRDGAAWLDGALRELGTHRDALVEGLVAGGATDLDERAGTGSLLTHRSPEGTYLAWLDLRPAFAASGVPLPLDLGGWLRRRTSVAVVDGALCGVAGAVRVNLAMPRPLVVEAGRRIAAALPR